MPRGDILVSFEKTSLLFLDFYDTYDTSSTTDTRETCGKRGMRIFFFFLTISTKPPMRDFHHNPLIRRVSQRFHHVALTSKHDGPHFPASGLNSTLYLYFNIIPSD